jgi:hypothetical protein
MEARFQNLREQGSKAKKSNPLVLEEFQWDNEWVDINAEMVHEDQAQVMDDDTPLLWSQVDEAMGASSSLAARTFLGEPVVILASLVHDPLALLSPTLGTTQEQGWLCMMKS